MKNYYEMKREELYCERIKLNNELDRIKHALSFLEVSEHNIKDLLWNRYELFKKETSRLLIVKYKGGNSSDPKSFEYYEAEQINDKIYENEISKDYLFWLNNNRHYLEVDFNWL